MSQQTTRSRRRSDRPPAVIIDAPACGIPTITTAEARFLSHPATYRLYSAGLGVDRVRIGALALLLESARPENRGCLLASLAATDAVSSDVHRPQILALDTAFADRHGFHLIQSENKSLQTMTTIFGSRILLASWGRRKSMVTYSLGAIWADGMDEKDPLPRSEIQRIMDTVKSGTRRIWWTDSARGNAGVHGMFLSKQAADPAIARRYAAFRAPSWTSPDVTAEDLITWRQTMSGFDWDGLVCTNLTAGGRKVFPMFGRAKHATSWAPAPGERHPYVIAVDWGTVHAHVIGAWVRKAGGLNQLVVARETHLQTCTNEDVINAVQSMITRDFGHLPEKVYLDGAPNAKDANRAFTRRFGTAFPHKRMGSYDKVIIPGIRVMRSALSPPPGREPLLLVHESLFDVERWPFGIVAALESTNWSIGRDGEAIDRVAENNRTEHALDTLRYLCVGKLGYRSDAVYTHAAV